MGVWTARGKWYSYTALELSTKVCGNFHNIRRRFLWCPSLCWKSLQALRFHFVQKRSWKLLVNDAFNEEKALVDAFSEYCVKTFAIYRWQIQAIHKPIHKLLISAGGSCSSRLTVTWALIKIAHKYRRGREQQPARICQIFRNWRLEHSTDTKYSQLSSSPPPVSINSLIVFTAAGWMMVSWKLELSRIFRGSSYNFRRLFAPFNKEKASV